MITELTISAWPWPKGCSLSAGLDEILKPIMTTREVSESERVCQASAMIAIEKVFTPTQYFKAKSKVLIMTEITPSKYPKDILYSFDIGDFVLDFKDNFFTPLF